ncbi:MAG: ATP-binding protein, partial [Clostridia bacterium]|nr:ATP-binding protein [Clostridia bacterium]
MITTDEKKQISEQLRAYCEQKGSQNKAAASLNGVSSATVSKVLAGNWDTIADDMWRSIAGQIGAGKTAEEWQLVPTRAYKT